MQPNQQQDDSKIMMQLIDKLCDHLPNQRIKLFIDNGFDQWQTITYMKGPQLIQLGFNSEQVIIIMIAINSNAKMFSLSEIFNQEQIQQTLKIAKQMDQKKMEEIQKQEQEYQKNINKKNHKQQQTIQQIQLTQYPHKLLTQLIMQKCIPGKSSSLKSIQKPSLSKVTLLQLQNKQLTQLSQQQMKKIPLIQNLYLAHNHIYKIQGLAILNKIKILRLQNNLIKKIQGLNSLCNLERLTLNQNFIIKIENLQYNKKLNYIDISSQKHKYSLQFDQVTFQALAYCLEKIDCNSNNVKQIDAFRHLAVVQEISLKNNSLEQFGQLTAALGQMGRIKKIDFRGNPLTKTPKYRDYIVILSKSLQQLDQKKILPKQRQYLVKLYSLKHAKQQKQQFGGPQKKLNNNNKILDLQGMKLQENDLGYIPKYVHGNDLRGNVVHANTKVFRK